jgi:DNA-binding Lrp family transcriptional regulator
MAGGKRTGKETKSVESAKGDAEAEGVKGAETIGRGRRYEPGHSRGGKDHLMERLDREILYELDNDASQPLSAIAKKVNRSVPTIDYRIRKMIEGRVLKSFLTIVNFKRLGYTNYFVYWTLRNVNSEKERSIIEQITKDDRVNEVFRWDGAWNLCVGVMAKDISELNEVVSRIKDRFSECIDREAFMVYTKSFRFGRRYLVQGGKYEARGSPAGSIQSPVSVDKTEDRILREIRDAARMSTVDLAERTGLPLEVVRYRLRKLRDEDIVVGATIMPDCAGFPQIYRILLNINGFTTKKEKGIIAYLGSKSNVVRVKRAFGAYNLAIDCEFEQHTEFRNFLFELKERFYDVISDQEVLTAISFDKGGYYLG